MLFPRPSRSVIWVTAALIFMRRLQTCSTAAAAQALRAPQALVAQEAEAPAADLLLRPRLPLPNSALISLIHSGEFLLATLIVLCTFLPVYLTFRLGNLA